MRKLNKSNIINSIGFYGDNVHRSLKSIIVYDLKNRSNNMIFDEAASKEKAKATFSYYTDTPSSQISCSTLQFYINHLNNPIKAKRKLTRIKNVGYYGDKILRTGKFLVAYKVDNPTDNLIYETLDISVAIHSFSKDFKFKTKGLSVCSLNTFSKKYGHLFN